MYSLCFTYDSKFISTASRDKSVRIFSKISNDKYKVNKSIGRYSEPVTCVAVSSDSRYIFTGSRDRRV